MELYNQNDLDLFSKHIEPIVKKIDEYVLKHLDPTQDERLKVSEIIIDYVKQKKRKIYGGYAVNLVIKDKNPSDAFYTNTEFHDIDFYSPDPLRDLVDLCNTLHEKNITFVHGQEALHKETYSIMVKGLLYCDISYVPKILYNHIPFLQIDGFTVTHPNFMKIDYMRMFTDPILSHFRWNDKYFKRYFLLQKYYPIQHSTRSLALYEKMDSDIYDNIVKFITNNKTLIALGFYVYNIYEKESKNEKKYIKQLPIPYFEFISIDYENDVKKIVQFLSENTKQKINIIEYYPFFQFTGFRTDILCNDKIIAKIYHHTNICTPYVEYDNKLIGSFHLNYKMCLVNAMHARTNENKDEEKMYYNMASHLLQMRQSYFDKKNETYFDNNIFKDFISNCIGFTQDIKIEKQLEIKKLKEEKKKLVFKYSPEDKKKLDVSEWKFSNSSGNKINNIKNYKIKFDKDDFHAQIKDEELNVDKDIKEDAKLEKSKE